MALRRLQEKDGGTELKTRENVAHLPYGAPGVLESPQLRGRCEFPPAGTYHCVSPLNLAPAKEKEGESRSVLVNWLPKK